MPYRVGHKKTLDDFSFSAFVGIPGLEPGKAGPESAVLPLHHIPIFDSKARKTPVSCLRVQRYKLFLYLARKTGKIFLKKSCFGSFARKTKKKCKFWEFWRGMSRILSNFARGNQRRALTFGQSRLTPLFYQKTLKRARMLRMLHTKKL